MDWDYGVAREDAAGARLKPAYSPFVGGRFVGGGDPLTVHDPATGEPLTEVATAGAADMERAIAAARRAQADWGASPARRARRLFRFADVVAGRANELALLEALDAGRPVRRARDDVSAVAAHLRSAAGWADKLEYAGLGPAPRPVGVVGVLVAGALPAVVRAVAPALACGNVVVLVPDPDAPLGALVLAEAGAEAGLPEGVLNVLPAGVLSGDVDAVAVTGPPAFCRDAARLAPGRPFHRRATGGLVQVVHDDAPLDQAVDGIVEALGGDQRVLVAESVADELAELLRERLARLRVGDPLDHNTDLGPLASPQQRDRAVALAGAADDEGARRWTGPAPLPERGWFLAPTVFTDVAPTMRIAREEIAGPLLPVLTFRTPAEAVATAGAPRAAAVWTDKGSRALWTAQRLRAGVTWVNAVGRWDPAVPAAALAEHLVF
jgi:aldehyde dehydrogenase (NAD+)